MRGKRKKCKQKYMNTNSANTSNTRKSIYTCMHVHKQIRLNAHTHTHTQHRNTHTHGPTLAINMLHRNAQITSPKSSKTMFLKRWAGNANLDTKFPSPLAWLPVMIVALKYRGTPSISQHLESLKYFNNSFNCP